MVRQPFAISALFCLSASTAMAAPPDTSACDAYSGAAKGVCTAYLANECDTEESGGSISCVTLGARFTELTGEPPPGSVVAVCPCDYSAVFADTFGGCLYYLDDSHSPESFNYFTEPGPDQLNAYSAFDGSVSTCGIGEGFGDHSNPVEITFQEFQACYADLAAEAYSHTSQCHLNL